MQKHFQYIFLAIFSRQANWKAMADNFQNDVSGLWFYMKTVQ